VNLVFPAEGDLLEFAGRFCRILVPGDLIFLRGTLGAGKTTLVRGCLQAWGHGGKVKSPTYTLVEEYRPEGFLIYHFDLYRLSDPEELEAMGIRDYLGSESICFVEWPERGEGLLPDPDFDLSLSLALPGRALELRALSAGAKSALRLLSMGGGSLPAPSEEEP
jgi:tRNA threonylcarbamoyladenosine biosynthesis protein TsaE